MRRIAAYVLLSLFFALLLATAGCEEATTSDVTKHRLIAVENERLKADMAKQDKRIARLAEQVEQCQSEKLEWKDKAQNQVKQATEGILSGVMEKNSQLQAEIEQLKVQLKELEDKTAVKPRLIEEPQAEE